MKNPITRIIIWLSVLALLPVGGCSDDETVAPDPNKPPTITFTTDKLAVPRTTGFPPSEVTFTVDVNDPDGDPVAVNWAVTRDGQPSGTLVSDQGQPSMTWRAPEKTGSDTITVVATDGKGGSTTLVETILVGTLHITSVKSPGQTWTLDTSPHIIRGNGTQFVIEARSTLAVDDGVVLLIDRPGLDVSVVGTLDIDGTAEAPVVIRPNSRSAEPGYWKGLTATPSSSIPRIKLDHTTVLYATDAVKASVVAETYLDGCTIMFSLESAVLHGSRGRLDVKNSAITNNEKSGIRIQRIQELTEGQRMIVDIRDNRITLNGDTSGETVYTDQAGIYIDLPDPLRLADIQIMENYIDHNGVPGIHLENKKAVYPEIHQNAIFLNEFGKVTRPQYNVKLGPDFSGAIPAIDARNNYWGGDVAEKDSTEIKKTILDSEDDLSIHVLVVIYPWLNTEP